MLCGEEWHLPPPAVARGWIQWPKMLGRPTVSSCSSSKAITNFLQVRSHVSLPAMRLLGVPSRTIAYALWDVSQRDRP